MALSRRGMLTASALLALLPGPLMAAPETASAFLKSIYGQYKGNSAGVPLDDDAIVRRWFTPAMAKLIIDDRARAATQDEVPNLDADPFISAQDWEISNVKITVEEPSPGEAVGHVTFRNFDKADKVDLDLIETKSGWRIDDIHWSEGSLRGLYSQ